MKLALPSIPVAIALGGLLPLASVSVARDHGVMGHTWPIIEQDLLATIQGKLEYLQKNGGLERMQQELAAKTKQRVIRPTPVPGIDHATKPRKWFHDPAVVLQNDIRDHKGNLIAAAGTKVNPLTIIKLTRSIVFVDGDSDEQLKWATSRYKPTDAKIVFVSGSPFERMKEYQRRFFFDQKGELTKKFDIQNTPAVVAPAGEQLLVEELVLGKARS